MRFLRFLGSFLSAAFLLLSGCASSLSEVKIERVELCEHGRCGILGKTVTTDHLLARLHALMNRNIDQDVVVAESDSQTHRPKGSGIRYYTMGGPLPFFVSIDSFKFTDVTFMDREKREIRFKLRPWSNFLAVPVLCAEGEGVVTVNAPDDVALTVSNLCTWMVVGSSSFDMKMRFDHIDLDTGRISGYYSVGHAGPTSFGKGSGYQTASFAVVRDAVPASPVKEAPSQLVALPPDTPATTASGGSAHSETVQILSQTPRLQFSLALADRNKNNILEAGEEIALVADITNQGDGIAEGVQLKLSGTKSLIDVLGANQPVGDIKPGGSKRVELRGVMPSQVSTENAQLKVELSENRGFSSSEARVLRMATRGAEVKEVVNTLSELSVDDIPPKVRSIDRSHDVAVVIGISSYREGIIPPVKYARRDAEVMAKYIENLSGVPAGNIALLTDANATKSDIEAYLDDWLPRRVTPESRVFVFYAGHGAPDLAGKGAYLVPYEGHPDFSSKLLPLERFYQSLSRLNAKQVVVFLDSCFSGAQGRSVVQAGVRPLVLTTDRLHVGDKKLIVLASASGSEATSDYDQVRHGLFPYFVLRGLRGEADVRGDGKVTVGELFDFVSRNVSSTASHQLNRSQTPVLLPAAASEILGLSIATTR